VEQPWNRQKQWQRRHPPPLERLKWKVGAAADAVERQVFGPPLLHGYRPAPKLPLEMTNGRLGIGRRQTQWARITGRGETLRLDGWSNRWSPAERRKRHQGAAAPAAGGARDESLRPRPLALKPELERPLQVRRPAPLEGASQAPAGPSSQACSPGLMLQPPHSKPQSAGAGSNHLAACSNEAPPPPRRPAGPG